MLNPIKFKILRDRKIIDAKYVLEVNIPETKGWWAVETLKEVKELKRGIKSTWAKITA